MPRNQRVFAATAMIIRRSCCFMLLSLFRNEFAASFQIRGGHDFHQSISAATHWRGAVSCSASWLKSPGTRSHVLTRREFPVLPRSSTSLHSTLKSNALESGELQLSKDTADWVSELVQKRSEARWIRDYAEADRLLDAIHDISLPNGLDILIRDIPRTQGGASTWTVVPTTSASEEQVLEGTPVLQLAHTALGLAVASSERNTDMPLDQLKVLVEEAKDRLGRHGVENELRGRKAADAAFWFALAGVTDESLFDSLSNICQRELERFGAKSSCRSKSIWHILERLAAAGVSGASARDLSILCRKLLQEKQDGGRESKVFETRQEENDHLLDLHSDRCLLMIWKFSTRQRKQQSFLKTALRHWEQHERTGKMIQNSVQTRTLQKYRWSDMFGDPNKPLVVDIGCGMGVSLLGMAQIKEDNTCPSLLQDVSDCNFVGVDLSRLAIGYAQGMSHRRGLSHRLAFVVDAAEHFLQCVKETYPGPVTLCLVQFPTPYRLPTGVDGTQQKDAAAAASIRGNSQLPKNATSGFMVTEELLRLTHEALRSGVIEDDETECGKLLLQSNCEDVAVWMHRTALNVGFRTMHSFGSNDGTVLSNRLPKRTLDWIAMGGERAQGSGWSSAPILPRVGATETEVACILNGTPIHRCVLTPGKSRDG